MAVQVPYSPEESQKALLAAIAQYGSLGRQIYEQTQQQLGAQRQEAIAGALQRAAGINAPAGAATLTATTAARPAAERQADLGLAQRLFDLSQQQRAGANRTYFEQLRAAVPVVEARTRAVVAQTAEEARQRALERELRQQQLELERRRLDLAEKELAAGGITKPQKVSDQEKTQVARKFIVDRLRSGASPGTQQAFFYMLGQNARNPAGALYDAVGSGAVVFTKDGRMIVRAPVEGDVEALSDAEKKRLVQDPDGRYWLVQSEFRGVSPQALTDWLLRYENPLSEYNRSAGAPSRSRPAPGRGGSPRLMK
jgi:hypothetical protein